ncbi:MAG: alpha-1,4-glucan--maltose-1-phosphate maltosyltransferase [Nocardioides sp.]
MVGRIPIIDISPVVDSGLLPAKATVGEPLPLRATVFREGHDQFGCEAVIRTDAGTETIRMRPDDGVDRWIAWFTPTLVGPGDFEIHAWSDPLGTWLHDAPLKIEADVDVDLMFVEGVLLLDRMLAAGLGPEDAEVVQAAHAACLDTDRPVQARLAVVTDPALAEVCFRNPLRELLTRRGPHRFFVDVPRALTGAWYEFFPRSEGARATTLKSGQVKVTSGTFKTAAKRLDAVAAMGFDVVYLPPIHPIGEINRKGPNNTLTAGPDDVGSPWAIGSRLGGHDAVHPDLGTIEDFDAFVSRAERLDLQVALDLALQCAPDHPWVSAHPEWFTTRADGTIAYAENPPKKYQDIYPVNFDNDPEGIYTEVLRVVRHWMAHGVRIFRVDNPHTKPVAFWERLLAEIRESDPDVLFLSEAFTRPPMMRALGAIGYHQSYTYFTWRTARAEIEDYLSELASESDHLLRPNFFVNTPDILHGFLQYGGPAAFRIRATLAAMGGPSWGVYAGFELFEHVAIRPGSEEYLDSEKYQIKIRDWAGAEAEGRSLAPYLTRLNEIRRAHPALGLLRNVVIHHADNDNILCFSKKHTRPDGTHDQVIVVINLDPHSTHEATVHLDLAAAGLPDSFGVSDEITGEQWSWGEHNYVRLAPESEVAHVLVVRGDTG